MTEAQVTNSGAVRDFPFFWIEKPSMASLQVLASHLSDQTQAFRSRLGSGYRGETSEMEKQIIEHMTAVEQQTLVLADVVQASIQILEDARPFTRVRRFLESVFAAMTRGEQTVLKNPLYRILMFLGAGWTLWYFSMLLRHLLQR